MVSVPSPLILQGDQSQDHPESDVPTNPMDHHCPYENRHLGVGPIFNPRGADLTIFLIVPPGQVVSYTAAMGKVEEWTFAFESLTLGWVYDPSNMMFP